MSRQGSRNRIKSKSIPVVKSISEHTLDESNEFKNILEKPKDYAELKQALDINELITILERSNSKNLGKDLSHLIFLLKQCQAESTDSKGFKDQFLAGLLKYKLFQSESDSLH